MEALSRFLLPDGATLRQAMQAIDANAHGIVLLINSDHKLLGILTDGDIRRALLSGIVLESPAREVMNVHPITGSVGISSQEVTDLMAQVRIRHLPIVDEAGRLVDLRFEGEPALAPTLPVQVVIMAGGFGERLRPLTDTIPKPLLRVGNRPILEITISMLYDWGIRDIWLAVNYKADMIESYFQDGAQWGVSIRYLREPKKLGTIGALSLIAETLDKPMLVMNGDILTRLDFRKMYRAHTDSHATMTVGVRRYDFQVPFGVINTDQVRIISLAEKPVLEFSVNTGIYLLDPTALPYIPRGTRFDATDLINALLNQQQLVNAYPIHEYWLDIGQLTDYERANREFNDDN